MPELVCWSRGCLGCWGLKRNQVACIRGAHANGSECKCFDNDTDFEIPRRSGALVSGSLALLIFFIRSRYRECSATQRQDHRCMT